MKSLFKEMKSFYRYQFRIWKRNIGFTLSILLPNKISRKLLRKIELYSILNNVKDVYQVPYTCESCKFESGPTDMECSVSHPTWPFKFCSDKNFRNFKKGWTRREVARLFVGCRRWVKK